MKSGILAVVATAISLFAVLGGVALADIDDDDDDGGNLALLTARVVALEVEDAAQQLMLSTQQLAIDAIEAEFATLPPEFPTLATLGQRVVFNEDAIDVILPLIGGIHNDIADLETADGFLDDDIAILTFVTDQRLLMLEAFHP